MVGRACARRGRRNLGISVALLFALLVAPFAHGVAAQGCLSVEAASFAHFEGRGDLPGYPGWELAIAYAADRMPFTPTLVAVGPGETCDLTRGLDAFLGARAAPATTAQAEEVALLAIAALFVDELPDAQRVGAPRFTPLGSGHLAKLDVWTPRNGVLARATVRMDGHVSASFVVREVGVGAFEGASEGWVPGPGEGRGFPDIPGVDAAGSERVIEAANADGTRWRVTYDPALYASGQDAEVYATMHLEAAVRAYANQTSWGFVSFDPDGVLEIKLDGACVCILAGDDADIHLKPRPNDLLPFFPGLGYRSEAEFAEILVSHELFHHFQYGLQRWQMGLWLLEGTARFSETIALPDGASFPSSMVYARTNNGMNGFLRNPARSIGQHTYDFSLVWGYLYAHDGGIALVKAVLEESADGGPSAEVDGVAAIDRALAGIPGREHATFAEAFEAFTDDVMLRRGFVWGAPSGEGLHDWMAYLDAPAREPSPIGRYPLPYWGFRVHDAAPTTPEGSALVSYVGAFQRAMLMSESEGARTLAAARGANIVAGVDDAALFVLSTAPPPADAAGYPGSYVVAVTRESTIDDLS